MNVDLNLVYKLFINSFSQVTMIYEFPITIDVPVLKKPDIKN